QPVNARAARGGASEAEENLDRGRFAGAIRAEEAEKLSLADAEIDAVQRHDGSPAERGAVFFPQAGHFNDCCRHTGSSTAKRDPRLRWCRMSHPDGRF